MTTSSVISALKITAIFTILIGLIYGVIIPQFFPSYKTYLILILGIAIAAIIGGRIGYQAPATNEVFIKVVFCFCYAIVIATLILLVSLFIILNIRGS